MCLLSSYATLHKILSGLEIIVLLLMLSPHLLRLHLAVVHRAGAVRSRYSLLLVVHLRGADARVSRVRIWVCVVACLLAIDGAVW